MHRDCEETLKWGYWSVVSLVGRRYLGLARATLLGWCCCVCPHINHWWKRHVRIISGLRQRQSPCKNERELTLVGSLGSRVGTLHTRQCLRYPLKEVLYVVAKLGTGFDKSQTLSLGLLLALLGCDLPLVVKIGLVAHQHNDDIVASLRSNVVNPFLGVLE